MLLALVLFAACDAHALDAATVAKLATGDGDEKVAAVAALLASGEERAAVLLKALADGEVQIAGSRVIIVKGESATDAISGAAIAPLPEAREDVVVNNRLRRELEAAMAALRLVSPDRAVRAAAVKELSGGALEAMRPLIRQALAKETDPDIKASLGMISAGMDLQGSDRGARLEAIKRLAGSRDPNTKMLLLPLADKGEADEEVRRAAQESLKVVEARYARSQFVGLLFSGVSLGSILLLAALGLAITYGLMGVINMAHGELIMSCSRPGASASC